MTKTYQSLMEADAKRAAKAGNASALENLAGSSGGDIDRVRSILFGDLPAMFEGAITRIAAQIDSQAATLRGEIESLEQRFDKRLAEIEARSTEGRNELRDQILSQSRLLTASIQEKSEQAEKLTKHGVNHLAASKLDRDEFSAFLRATADHFSHSGSPCSEKALHEAQTDSETTEEATA